MGSVPAAATNKTWVVQGMQPGRSGVMIARALVEPEARSAPLRLLNPREVTISKGTVMAELESVAMEDLDVALV